MIPLLQPILDTFRTRWRSATLIGVVAAVSIAVVASIVAFRGPTAGTSSLSLIPFPSSDAGIRWSRAVKTPNSIQQEALDQLFGWLTVVAWAAALVGLAAVLAMFAQRASQRA